MNAYERKQATILVIAIVVVVLGGFLWYRSSSGVAVTPPVVTNVPPPAPVVSVTPTPALGGAAPSAAAGAAKPAGPGSTPSTAGSQAPAKQPEVITSNPFKKVLPDTTGGTPAPSAAAAPSMVARGSKMPELPPVSGGLQPFSPTEAINGAFRLQGIVSSRRGPMAVVSFGGTTLLLRPGDKFGRDLRMVSIGRQTITIARSKKTAVIEVGGGLGSIL